MASNKTSAGLLMYRRRDHGLEVFLVHLGGPFHRKKDRGGWSILEGEYADGDDPRATALREFEEETGRSVAGDHEKLAPVGRRVPLGWRGAGAASGGGHT